MSTPLNIPRLATVYAHPVAGEPTPVQIMWLGHYRVQSIPSLPDKVSIIDTRTGEGGSFDLTAFAATMEAALDTFFAEEF